MVEIAFEYMVQVLMSLFFFSLIGILFVEFFNSPKGFERMIDPLCRRVIRRYEFVKNRT